jgi:hypothetical protein
MLEKPPLLLPVQRIGTTSSDIRQQLYAWCDLQPSQSVLVTPQSCRKVQHSTYETQCEVDRLNLGVRPPAMVDEHLQGARMRTVAAYQLERA